MNDPKTSQPGGTERRQRSTIGFPYTDYDSVCALTTAIHKNVGHGECSLDQLAAWTHQSSKSSSFRVQQAAAKMFGMIENGAESGSVILTELGRRTVDPDKAINARAEAFLNVPLFSALYDKYVGGVTPPNLALETEIGDTRCRKKTESQGKTGI